MLKNPLYIGKVAHQGKRYEGQHAAILDNALWEAAQTTLRENKNNHDFRKSVKDPSLLAGLLFDDCDNVMSPTHTKKHNRRYRYYVNQAVLQYREKDAGTVLRLPAKAIEGLVLQRLKQLWQSPNELLDIVKDFELSAQRQHQLIERARAISETWDNQSPNTIIPILHRLLKFIRVGRGQVDLELSKYGTKTFLLDEEFRKPDQMQDRHDRLVITVPAQLKRSGIESKLIVDNNDHDMPHQSTISAIQNALSKSLKWHDVLISGACKSATELAKREQISQRYVANILKLAFLAPDIMSSILKGNIPRSLTLTQLTKGFPTDWNEQRKMLGFS